MQHLTDIINNILSRRGSSTALSATMSTLTSGTQGYSAGYDTSDYSGFLIKQDLDPVTGAPGATDWDASCTLTGGTFSGGVCTLPTPLPDASVGRTIVTANDAGTAAVTFTSFSSLSSAEQIALTRIQPRPRSARVDRQHRRLRRQWADPRRLAATACAPMNPLRL